MLGHKWEATNFCKCEPVAHSHTLLSILTTGRGHAGICFGTNYTILHMDVPDDPSKPCLSCTKQWCHNQNLPKCAGASVGDVNPDTATGKEGDIEARCFRACFILASWPAVVPSLTEWFPATFSPDSPTSVGTVQRETRRATNSW